MIGATFCSGIGAPEVAAPFIDWRLASEIEAFPRRVLSQRFGCVASHRAEARGKHELWGDLAALKPRHMRRLQMPWPNIMAAGTPCQAFSLAGLRQSLNDDRGNLTFIFLRLVHAIRNAARPVRNRSAESALRWLVWENVPGVLSTADNAFGNFLAGIVGASDALSPPGGGKWPDSGLASGPWAWAAWRVLDAQHFGLAQRRRRVFLVAGFGAGCDPAAVLFERLGVSRDHPPRRQEGEVVAGTLSSRTSGGGGRGPDFELDGGLIAGTVSSKWAKGTGSPAGDECYNLVAHTLRAEGFDASEDGTGGFLMADPVRWNAIVTYRSDYGSIDCEYQVCELDEIDLLVERGPHWDTIEKIEITRLIPLIPDLTIEAAEKL